MPCSPRGNKVIKSQLVKFQTCTSLSSYSSLFKAGWQNQGYASYIVARTYTEKVGLIDWRIGKGKKRGEKKEGRKRKKGKKKRKKRKKERRKGKEKKRKEKKRKQERKKERMERETETQREKEIVVK